MFPQHHHHRHCVTLTKDRVVSVVIILGSFFWLVYFLAGPALVR